jgi:hypothetical protein
MEIWKDIQGYEGLYEVSNFGNINSLDRYVMGKGGNLIFQKGIKKKNQPHKEGYWRIFLSKNGIAKSYLVHRLVAIAFIPNPESKLQVNHKDLNRANTHVDNLEWVTNQENAIHGYKNNKNRQGISGEKHYKSILNSNDVIAILELKNNGVRQKELAAMFKVSRATIYDVVNGKSWQSVSKLY